MINPCTDRPTFQSAAGCHRLAMTEPDPRSARLVELRQQLETMARQVLTSPIDSLERDALSKQFRVLMDQVLDLRRELEG